MITDEQKSAIARCLERGLPFAIYQMPGGSGATLLTADSDGEQSVRFFACDFADRMSQMHTLSSPGPAPQAWTKSTTMAEHIDRVSALTRRLGQRPQAKTVLSATHCSPCTPMQALDMACRLFARSTTEFCSFYSMPSTGIWLGATPEALLRCDASGRFSTMALAGTMPASDTEWSQKNISEHRVVARYIERILQAHGAKFETSATDEATYGSVKHLHTRFEGVLPRGAGYESLIDDLNPTPALCGYPLADALADIADLEDHPRRCYGGIVGIISQAGVQAFVNIRCANIGADSMCVYAGGGIMPDSDPRAEWAEALAKRDSLLKMLQS